MAITIVSQKPDLLETFEILGVRKPALAAFLPRNLSHMQPEEFLYPSETKTLRKLLSDAGFPHSLLETHEIRTAFLYEKSAEWVAPTLYIAYALSDASFVVYLNVLSAYLYDRFRNRSNGNRVKLDLIVETTPDGESKRVNYEGDVSGLAELPKVIRELKK